MSTQRIYRILAEALILRRVAPSAVAGVAMMGAFSKVITSHVTKFTKP